MSISKDLRAVAIVGWIGLLAVGLSSCEKTVDTEEAAPGPEPGSVEWKIQNAMSAAPASVAEEATIMDWATGSAPTLLRAGTNEWTCFPSAPRVPSNDPKCVDGVAAQAIQALDSQARLQISSVGVSYMLAGGATASTADPLVRLSLDSDEWIEDPPHVMLYLPQDVLDASELPTDPGQGGPWIMWAGTGFAHLMVPTAPVGPETAPDLDRTTVEWMSRNARSAAPEAAVQGATIIGWAAGRGSESTMVNDGGDEWHCATDSPSTPLNDPNCLDRESWRWEQAFAARMAPDISSLGIGYMLQGGVIADLSDPFATEPPAGQDWIVGPPHVMLFVPLDQVDLSGFPDQPARTPWVHLAGTPFAHLMIPVQ